VPRAGGAGEAEAEYFRSRRTADDRFFPPPSFESRGCGYDEETSDPELDIGCQKILMAPTPLVMNSKPLVFAFLALVTAAVCNLAADETKSGAAQNPAFVRVMSFNVRNSKEKDGKNGWQYRKELFSETVRKFDPDILGLQEVLADQYDDFLKMFADYTMVGVARDDGARKGEWAALLFRKARFEQIDSGNFWLSETPDEVGSKSWNAACVRICTWAKLQDRITGSPVLIANTHFDHKSELARVQSAKLFFSRLPKLAPGAPVILIGDFNCDEDDDAYRTLVHSPLENGMVLSDSYREVHPERSPNEASFHGFKGGIVGSRIDWILHTPEFKATEAEIVRPAQGPYPSDHFPVTAVLEFKRQ